MDDANNTDKPHRVAATTRRALALFVLPFGRPPDECALPLTNGDMGNPPLSDLNHFSHIEYSAHPGFAWHVHPIPPA